jgi:hypothetical protein
MALEDPEQDELGQAGSTCLIKYVNGDCERIRVLEMSDEEHRISYKILSSSPQKLAPEVISSSSAFF